MAPLFTTDWFDFNIANWRKWLAELVGQESCRALEIGSWEGRSATWLLENVLTHPSAHMTCLDTWEGSIEHTPEQVDGVFQRFKSNMQEWQDMGKLEAVRAPSHVGLRQLPLSEPYDLIYVDAAHASHNALEDAVLAWRLLKVGGIMIFDDYLGGPNGDVSQLAHSPHQGINAFIHIYGNGLQVMGTGYQVAVRKTAELL